MIERIPDDIPDVPDTPELNAAKDRFNQAYYDAIGWAREGNAGERRSALVLLAQMILISLEREPLMRLTARLRHFLENEAVRRDFFSSCGLDYDAEWSDEVLRR